VTNVGLEAEPVPSHGRDHSVVITAPPLGVTFLAPAP
jgi:hypothetical protein